MEDKTQQLELVSCQAYAEQVRNRLITGVW